MTKELALLPIAHKNTRATLTLSQAPNFQDALSQQSKVRLEKDQATEKNAPDSNHSKAAKQVDKPAHPDKKTKPTKHEASHASPKEVSAPSGLPAPLTADSQRAINPETEALTAETDGVDSTKMASALNKMPGLSPLASSAPNGSGSPLNGLSPLASSAEWAPALSSQRADSRIQNWAAAEIPSAEPIIASSVTSTASPLAAAASGNAANVYYANSANWQHEVSQKIIWMNHG